HRFVENPADTMTRAVGLAHFSIGWLFLFSSPRLRNRAALARLTFWTCFGVAFCWVFAEFGADKNPLLMMAFYSFFFIHEVCDEAHLFRHSGELSDSAARADRFLPSLSWGVSLVLMAVLAAFQILRGHVLAHSPMLRETPGLWLFLGWGLLTVLAGCAIINVWPRAPSLYGSVTPTLAPYPPLPPLFARL